MTTLAAATNLEGQLSVSIFTLVLTTAVPAVLLSVIVWIFWRAAHGEASEAPVRQPRGRCSPRR